MPLIDVTIFLLWKTAIVGERSFIYNMVYIATLKNFKIYSKNFSYGKRKNN
jgi:hypothetical protein